MHFIDIVRRTDTISYNIQSFSYPDVGVVFDISILYISHNLADADPAGTLDQCSGTQNEQKNTHNTVNEIEIRTLST